MIAKCNCIHESQDKIHGNGMRVFNKVQSSSGNRYRCSVCLREIGSSSVDTKKKKKK